MLLPDPTEKYPFRLPDGSINKGLIFLAAAVDHPRMKVGDFTYVSVFDPPTDPAQIAGRLAPYLFPFSRERLEIGRFCAIAHGVQIITSSANHDRTGVTTYPFAIFDTGARATMEQPDTRDTLIGNDVWIGHGATILPGARIGDGAIIGAGSVVSGQVPPYAVVSGNPAQIVRMRFSATEIAGLQALAWWDWPPERIAANLKTLQSGSAAAILSANA